MIVAAREKRSGLAVLKPGKPRTVKIIAALALRALIQLGQRVVADVVNQTAAADVRRSGELALSVKHADTKLVVQPDAVDIAVKIIAVLGIQFGNLVCRRHHAPLGDLIVKTVEQQNLKAPEQEDRRQREHRKADKQLCAHAHHAMRLFYGLMLHRCTGSRRRAASQCTSCSARGSCAAA